jgi:hypothetical protein
MALTSSGFYGGDNYSVGMAKNVDASPDQSGTPAHEAPPARHPITNTAVPQSTGAGKGGIRTGRMR